MSDLKPLTLLCDESSTTLIQSGATQEDGAHICASAVIRSNSGDMVRYMALEGMGIALLAEPLVEGDIDCGSLVRILPEYSLPETGMQIAFASRRNLPPSVRAFVDCLVEQCNGVSPASRFMPDYDRTTFGFASV